MVEILCLKAKFLYDRVQNSEPPSPLIREGWDGGDEGLILNSHPDPPSSP